MPGSFESLPTYPASLKEELPPPRRRWGSNLLLVLELGILMALASGCAEGSVIVVLLPFGLSILSFIFCFYRILILLIVNCLWDRLNETGTG